MNDQSAPLPFGFLRRHVEQVVQMLRGDAQMRAVFMGKIATPVADKMLECGLVP